MFGKRQPSAAQTSGDAGRIVGELILPREAAESSDPYELIGCTIKFVNYMLDTGQFQPVEMIQEPIWSYQVDYYLAQVNNGGHEQYVGNSGIATGKMGPTIEATQRGLGAMGAHDYGAIYASLLELLDSGRSGLGRVAQAFGFGGMARGLEELDQRFFALAGTDRLIRQNRDFLLSLKSLRLVTYATWQAELDAVVRLNPRREERAAALEQAREEREANDPHIILAKELCRRSGRGFDGWTAVNPGCKLDGQDVHGWFMRTDRGPAVAVFAPGEALLFEPDMSGATPMSHFSRRTNLLAALQLSAA